MNPIMQEVYDFAGQIVAFSPALVISTEEIESLYYDYPQGRPHSITFEGSPF